MWYWLKSKMDPQPNSDFSATIETLTNMFGDVMSKDVIIAVVESCDGDLNLAAEAVMNMTSDAGADDVEPNIHQTSTASTVQPVEAVEFTNTTNPPPAQDDGPDQQINQMISSTTQPLISYASASQSMGAIPKQIQKPARITSFTPKGWTDQLRNIIMHHTQGSRILILMRGVPGSGKTFLAKQLIEMTIGPSFVNYKTHICSTDDYFMNRGMYQYNKFRISDAHEWNQRRVMAALRQGLSPVIIDNTNIEIWEMEPYVREGVKNGYIIEVVEPTTPWARNAYQLLKRNTHNVPAITIRRMLDNYQDGITGEMIKMKYGLAYPSSKVPPVLRNIPAFSPQDNVKSVNRGASSSVSMESPSRVINNEATETENTSKSIAQQIPDSTQAASANVNENQDNVLTSAKEVTIDRESDNEEEIARRNRYAEIEKQIEEINKVELEWENGETWEDEAKKTVNSSNENPVYVDPKPPRKINLEETNNTDLMEKVQNLGDWRQVSLFLPSWNNETLSQQTVAPKISVETKSNSTCIEIGDTDWQSPIKPLKTVSAVPRDINLFNLSVDSEKIPDKRKLHKGTMTNEFSTQSFKCQHEEQHFVAFRKLFKNLPKADLRDIFEKCNGDVNWAVDIILGSMESKELKIDKNEDVSDDEEIVQHQCECLAAYGIVPDTAILTASPNIQQDNTPEMSTDSLASQRKAKFLPSESSVQLKRQIEKNVVISDDHYSQHCLKIRKMRRGENSSNEDILEQNITVQNSGNVQSELEDKYPSTSGIDNAACANEDHSDDEESNASSAGDAEKTVNIVVGMEFISKLDELFGRKDMSYPENIVPSFNIPVSLLNEINAFWLESLMHQLDEQDRRNAKLVEEDAEFARQLAIKEAEMAAAGREPVVPDFKEIMDLDLAISLYQKDVAEWKNKEPDNIAARLTRDKLYNLFPEMCQDTLAELLMAHDNNFQATVESLLMSTDKSYILEEKNGFNKFVMEKEMQRQEKILEEQKKKLEEEEWPSLPKGNKVDMATIERYRDKADRHLAERNSIYQKAQEYMRRGMTQVACYYSDLGAFHTRKYEQANSMAVAYLMEYQASRQGDECNIDFHFLRVGEAREALDIFLDTHIMKLKESSNGQGFIDLYLITGRGKHSNWRPKIKPAVKRRLQERGLSCKEKNPGMFKTTVRANDRLSHQVQVP